MSDPQPQLPLDHTFDALYGLEVIESLCLSILAEIAAYRGETEKARRAIPELLRVVEAGGEHGVKCSRAIATIVGADVLRVVDAAGSEDDDARDDGVVEQAGHALDVLR